jgi:hypothetical protein
MSEIECGALQDRMPDVAAGTGRWNAQEAAHLAICPECAPEWQIVQTARRLGGSAARQIDSSMIAGNVVAALRARKKKSRWRRASWVSGLAAAAIVVVILRTAEPPSRRAAEPPDTTVVAVTPVGGTIPMAELEALDAEQLEAVLEQLDGATGRMDGGGIPSMGDLDDQQLERVLRSLEG